MRKESGTLAENDKEEDDDGNDNNNNNDHVDDNKNEDDDDDDEALKDKCFSQMLTVYIVPNGSTIRRGWGNKESSDSLFIS
jgi:hypothetical protein